MEQPALPLSDEQIAEQQAQEASKKALESARQWEQDMRDLAEKDWA